MGVVVSGFRTTKILLAWTTSIKSNLRPAGGGLGELFAEALNFSRKAL